MLALRCDALDSAVPCCCDSVAAQLSFLPGHDLPRSGLPVRSQSLLQARACFCSSVDPYFPLQTQVKGWDCEGQGFRENGMWHMWKTPAAPYRPRSRFDEIQQPCSQPNNRFVPFAGAFLTPPAARNARPRSGDAVGGICALADRGNHAVQHTSAGLGHGTPATQAVNAPMQGRVTRELDQFATRLARGSQEIVGGAHGLTQAEESMMRYARWRATLDEQPSLPPDYLPPLPDEDPPPLPDEGPPPLSQDDAGALCLSLCCFHPNTPWFQQ